eukprot:9487003-Pyramimonas_sp.AAC.1
MAANCRDRQEDIVNSVPNFDVLALIGTQQKATIGCSVRRRLLCGRVLVEAGWVVSEHVTCARGCAIVFGRRVRSEQIVRCVAAPAPL